MMTAAFLSTLCIGSPPHVWLTVADDLGYGDLGYTGSQIHTPNIDKLATGGRVLTRYYVNLCCSPSRAMLLTGRYNVRYGLQTQVIPNNRKYGLPLNETLLPELLKREGYATHAIGKWHLGLWHWGYTPTYRGFDSFLGYYSGSQDGGPRLGPRPLDRCRSIPFPIHPPTRHGSDHSSPPAAYTMPHRSPSPARCTHACMPQHACPRVPTGPYLPQDYFSHRDEGFDFRLDVGARCGDGCSVSVADRCARRPRKPFQIRFE